MWRIRKEIIYPVSFSRFLAVIKFNNEWYDTQGDGTWSDSYIASRKKTRKIIMTYENSSFLIFPPSHFTRKHSIGSIQYYAFFYWRNMVFVWWISIWLLSNTALDISFKTNAECVSVRNWWSLFLRWFGSGWWNF